MRTRIAKLAFNRGLVSRLGLARADVKRLALAAETMVNWTMRVLGSMMLRPGMAYLGNTASNLLAFHLKFEFSVTDKAIVELTNAAMRIWVDDALVTRPTVATAITNGTFTTDVTGWTDADEAGATSDWVATGGYDGLWTPAGLMRMVGTGTAFAIRRQQLTVALADRNVEHGLRIKVANGPVVLRVGSSSGTDDLISETELGTGEHHLAFTPAGASAWVEFKSRLERQILIDACEMAAAGVLTSNAPWLSADLRLVRYDQSADVLFVACAKTTDNIGYEQWRIERRGETSWSVVLYRPEDGPFRTENVSVTTLTASALSGNITLTASAPIFRAGHVGALFQHTSIGQQVTESITAQNVFSDEIRVTGVNSTRIFTIIITGLTGTGSTVNLQRSLDEPGNWEDVTTGGSPASPWTANTTRTYDDGLDNQIVYYRIGVKTGNYAAGTIVCSLQIGTGSIVGVARITAITSELIATAEVLTNIGSVAATDIWAEGMWSDRRGFPTSVAFHEGRLTWAGRDTVGASISDAFDGFDQLFEGDAAPIVRSIGAGPVDSIAWSLSLQRLLLGGQGAEYSVRSSSLDEPLTPTNFNLKKASTQGSANVAAVQIDQNGAFVQRGGTRVYELSFGDSGIDYEATHLSALIPEIGQPGIVKIVVQRQPDTRLHCIRSDGTVALLVFDKVEQVIAWCEIETDGEIEDAVILPGDPGEEEDWVYYSVKRTINSATVRFLEKWAFESECVGGTLNKQADAFVTYTQAASATIGGLTHLVGESVVVWDNGKCLRDTDGEIETFTVNGSGQITVTNNGAAYSATNGVVGVGYTGSWKSAKLVELMENPGGSLLDRQRLRSLGLIMADVHAKGVKYGYNLTEADMRDLPEIEEGTTVDPDAVRVAYSQEPFAPPNGWSTDDRICLLAKAPRPVTILAALAELEHHG